MSRVKRGIITKKTHRKLKKKVARYIASRRASVKRAREAVLKAGQHAYRDRRRKKRELRQLWILQINNAARINGLKYSIFVKRLKEKKIELNRKILAYLAVSEPKIFAEIVKKVK